MMNIKKVNTKKIILLICIFACISCSNSQKEVNKSRISLQTFEIKNGWGYTIIINEKAFINQERIPGIKGNYPFKSKEDAEKIGELMIKKLKERKMPSISLEELKEAKIELPE